MILFSPNLVLTSPTEDFGPDNGVLGYHNLVTSSNITASDQNDSYPDVNMASPATYNRWVSDSDDEQTIEITLDYDGTVDYVAIARHNFSSGVQVAVAALTEITDSDGFFEYEDVVVPFIPEDDSPILIRFTPQYTTSIRITLTPDTSILPTIGVVYVGKLLILPRRIYVGHTPITDGIDTRFYTNISESGEFLGRVITGENLTTGFNMQNIDPVWFRNNMRQFIRAAKELPFFWAWRPYSFPREVGYAWLTNNPKPNNQRPNGMVEIELQMGAISS